MVSYKRTVGLVHPGHSDDHSIFRPPPPSFQQSSKYHLYTGKGIYLTLTLPHLCLGLLGSRSQSPTEFHQSSEEDSCDSLSSRLSTVWVQMTA